MEVEIWKHYFVAQIKSSLYPASVLCLLLPPPPPPPLLPPSVRIPSLNSNSHHITSPSRGSNMGSHLRARSRGLLAILPGADGLSQSPEEPNASLSLYLSVSLCVCMRVSSSPCVSLLSVPPVAAFPSAHPESRSLAVLAPLQDVDVGAGEMALFECLVAGPADVEVDWLCRGRLLQPALLKCKMHFDGRKCKLLLTSVHEDDSGVYTCKLSTAKGKTHSGARATVVPRAGEGTGGAGYRIGVQEIER